MYGCKLTRVSRYRVVIVEMSVCLLLELVEDIGGVVHVRHLALERCVDAGQVRPDLGVRYLAYTARTATVDRRRRWQWNTCVHNQHTHIF